MTGSDFKSGKTEHDENFPVASKLIAPRFRGPILAFYRFARAADDAADHPTLVEDDKFALLNSLEQTLTGKSDAAPDALPLRRALVATGLSARHPLDLLTAFRQDVTKRRYRDWDELMHYCRYSAMPVGRFVLDVHGESEETWVPSDALCSALQVINHLQDCAKDYRTLDRVYIPLDTMEAHATSAEALAAPATSPQLRACLTALLSRVSLMMPLSAELPQRVRNIRLSMETAAIGKLANALIAVLQSKDPLSERVHLSSARALFVAGGAAGGAVSSRIARYFFSREAARGDTR